MRSSRTWSVGLVAVLVVGLGGCLLPPPPPWTGEGPRVLVLGDSLVYSVEEPLTDRLHDADHAASVSSAVGARTDQLLEPDLPVPWPAPDVVVVALGTNDMRIHETNVPDPDVAAQNVARGFARFGDDACQVAVTIAETEPWGLDVNGPVYNGLLRADVIVEWDEIVAAHPEYVTPVDEVHLTPEGQMAYRDAIVDGVEECDALAS